MNIILLLFAFALGYWVRSLKQEKTSTQTHKTRNASMTYQDRLKFKAQHQTDSDRIRELNKLNTNESVFLRLLKQTFTDYDIAIKQKRFFILNRDALPCAIFEYRDGTVAMKLVDQEDGLPLYLYKGLLSSDQLKQDYIHITSVKKSPI